MMNNIQISVLLVVAILTPSEEYKFGFENRYTCHCKNDEICDKVTGSCNNGCLKGWGGPSCQQENIALGSDHVSQSDSLVSSYGPKQAVDGYTDTSWTYDHPCIHTSFSPWSWWFIVLQRQFSIRFLKTFYKASKLDDFIGFSVHIDDELCFKHTGSSPPSAAYGIECGKTITGRNVNISNNRPGDSLHYLSLCEVEIYVCSRGTYGPDCNNFCHCSNDDECDVKTGECTNVCPEGFYGEYCNQFCYNCNGNKCDDNGNCADGCINGYVGRMCDTICPVNCRAGRCHMNGTCIGCMKGYYGDICGQSCGECKDDECDSSNGECVLDGCKEGYWGEDGKCNTPCSTYCLHGKCNNTDGVCIEGCETGYHSLNCTSKCTERCQNGCSQFEGTCTTCEEGWYGNTCDKPCSSRCLRGCEQTRGICNQCTTGYYGEYCKITCSQGCTGKECNQDGSCKCNDMYYGAQCTGRCSSNCLNRECYNSESGPTCTAGCIDGYKGSYCQDTCLDNCIRCNRYTNQCTSCKTGWFGDQCQNKCNSNCVNECNQLTGLCQSCKIGWYGDQCQTKCNSNCDNECNKSTGRCQSCQTGWYGDQCQNKCNSNCVHECNQVTGGCQRCKTGWYGDQCQSKCNSNCINRCDQATGRCTSCKDGYHGSQCMEECPDNCSNNCNQDSARCKSCKSGTYGDYCNVICSTGCLPGKDQSTCDRDGRCTVGCINGRYGYNCNGKCSTGCNNGTCNKHDGGCISGCIPGKSGRNCTEDCSNHCIICNQYDNKNCSQCHDGYYGQSCKQTCSKTCQSQNNNLVCNKNNGYCTIGCIKGYYGDVCNSECSSNCFEKTCNQGNGFCTTGCIDGYKGSYCQDTCLDNCISCNIYTDQCTSCKTGWFGDQCQTKCNSNCDNECNKSTGRCQSCKTGWYGDQCQTKCNSNCVNECDKSTGRCVDCKVGTFGQTCSEDCSSGCLSNGTDIYCNRNGHCRFGCIDDRYGSQCNKICNDKCNSGCDTQNGTCISCKTGYHGQTCDQNCSPNCDGCRQYGGYCDLCLAGYYGDRCDKICSTNCNGECNKMSGKCEDCLNGFYGDYCVILCKNCDGGCDQISGSCTECVQGFHGNSCEHRCSLNCEGGCIKASGKCNHCKSGFYGIICNAACSENCLGQCHRVNGYCDCNSGFYGNKCDKHCSKNCEGGCSQSTGDCEKCNNGLYGKHCKLNCPKGCLNGICSKDEGSCKDGCVRGKRDKTCASDCKLNCKSCDQYDYYNCGECGDGWYGSSCNNRCPSNCIKCNPRTGDCSECRITWYGKSCNHQCTECSDGICAMNGTCINGCINGKYGNHCQNNCSYSCKQPGNGTGICEQKTGKCIEGCRVGYQGENCNEVEDPVCNNNPTITVPETLGDACVNLSAICNGAEGLRLEYSIPTFIVTTLENGDMQICGNTSAAPYNIGVSQIQATVSDGFNTLDITMNLVVTGVNKYSPVFNNLPNYLPIEIPEDTLVGSDVFTFTITDDDVGSFGKFTVTSKMEALESGTFEVVDDDIKLLRKLNASLTPIYKIFLTATDTGGLSDNLTVEIQVQDVNEPPVCIQQATFNISVLIDDGEVGKLSCYDYDVNSLFKQIQYNLIQPQSKSVPFTVEEDGMLKVTGSLLELPETVEFTVEASTGDQAKSIAVRVYISLEDPVCNNNPTITVPETLGEDCVNLSAICNGAEGLRLEYSIPSFIVKTLENGDIQICGNTSAAPFKIGDSQIQATVSDGFNTLDITMNLAVTGVNKYSPVFNNLPNYLPIEIPEDTLVGSDVFTFTITDDDVGNFGKFTVTSKMEALESGTFEVVDDDIKLLRKLNASLTPIYTIFLTATDTGGLSDNLTVKIQVQDVNEPPVCIEQATFNISVLMDDGEVGKLSCYDYDVNPLFKQIQYNLIQPQSMSVPFTVEDDGMVKVTGSLLELPETVEFTVEASTRDQVTSIAVRVYISPIPILEKVLISFSVTNRVWDNRMVNNQSLEYRQLKQETEENFMVALSNDPGFAGIEIINMRTGNVRCDGVIFVNESGTVQNTSQIFLLQVSTGTLGNLSIQDVIVYQGDQHISSSNITLLEGDPDKLLEGTSIEYDCKFRLVGTHEAIKPIVKWFLDEIPLTHTSRIKMRNLTDSGDRFGYQYIIQFDKATSSHAGLLKCMVQSTTNSSINTSATETVKIISIPVVTLWPLSTFLQSGESITLQCSSAISPVTYSWFDALANSEIVSARDKDVYNVSDVDKDIEVYCKGENLAGTTQSTIATVYYASFTSESVTCTNSTDARNTTWPSVKAGITVKLSCGEEYSDGGFAERDCSESGDWRQPDYSNCKRSKLIRLKRGTGDVKEGKIVTTPKTTLQTLASLTTDGKQFAAGDVEVSVQILMDVVDITNDDTKVEIGEPELKNFAQSASNILDADDEEWKTLAEQGKSGIAVMMDTVDTMAKLCSSRLEDKEPITASTDKMVIEIGKFEEGSNGIEFPGPSSKSYPDWVKTSSNKVILRKDTLVNDNTDIKDISYNAVFYNDISKIVEGRILSPGESIDSESNETAVEINSKILAVSVYPPPKRLDPPIELSFQHLSDDYPATTCVFLDLKPPYDKRGRWSTEGCKTESTSNPNVTICKCNHLTNFAILMSPGITPIKHREALSIISAIGCAISTFCLLLTVVVYIYFWRYVKSDKAIILMNLCVTLILAYTIFLGGVNRTDIKALCQTVAVLLHFFFLAVFFLMLAEGVQVLISVVALAMTSRLKWILSASWGLPVVIVVISVAVTQLEGYGNDNYCWLSFESGLLWAFIGPALAVILVNAIIMIKVLTVMFSTTTMVTKSVKEKGRTGLKALCVLLPIIGLTWVFGVFSVNGYAVIFQYLFAIFNSLQGLFIFIFHCFLNRQVKEAIKIKRRRYRAKSIDTGTKSVTQSNQTRSTCDNDKVTSFIDEKTLPPVLEADCQVNII